MSSPPCPRHLARPVVAAFVCIAMALSTVGPAAAQYTPPVDGVVVDGFRPPAHVGAPGNRGWEYLTTPGSPVRAAGAGIVVFAGRIGASQYISIDHSGGLRTTYSHVLTIAVGSGDAVRAGQVIGSAAGRFHFGVRRNGVYVDPILLFAMGPAGPPHLVPRPGRVPLRTALGTDSGPVPVHSGADSSADRTRRGHRPGHDQRPPRTTHGRRFGGVGPRLR